MDAVELSRLIRDTIAHAEKSKLIGALKVLRRTIPDPDLAAFDAIVDVLLSGVEDNPEAITVVLVHGIRTAAEWQHLVSERLSSKASVNTRPIGYGFFSAFGLWGPFRGGPVAKIARELRDIRRLEPKSRLMIIAHSYGTYIVARLLKEAPDIRCERLILCGSIVSKNFRWDILAGEHDKCSIVNDVGTKDPFPVLARCTTLGYGATGRFGFQTARVTDRFFDLGHSDFFSVDHVDKFWQPFLLEGRIERSPWDTQRPPAPYLASLFSLGPVAVVAVVTLLCIAVWALAWAVGAFIA